MNFPSAAITESASNSLCNPGRFSRFFCIAPGRPSCSAGSIFAKLASAFRRNIRVWSMSSATRDTSVNCWDSRTCRNSTLKRLSWTAETSASSPSSAAVAIRVTFDLMLVGFTPALAGDSAPQLEPLYLPCRGLRQLGEELDPARVLVGRELVLDVPLQLGLQGVACGIALLENDKGFGLDELALVFGADHRRFEHGFMRDESGFDLGGRDVDARDLQHVVGAPAVYVVAVPVQAVLVTALRPASHESAAAFLVVVPVAGGARRPADLQLSHLALLLEQPR